MLNQHGGEHVAKVEYQNADVLDALRAAQKLIETARRYFPKSVSNSDRFELELTCAAVTKALRQTKDEAQPK